MLNKLKNNKFVLASLIVLLILGVTAGFILSGATDAYFTDNTDGGASGTIGKMGIEVGEIVTSFSDSTADVENTFWGEVKDLSFYAENKGNIALDIYPTITITSDKAVEWEEVVEWISIYDKSSVSEMSGAYVLNENAVAIGDKTVLENGIQIALPVEVLSGSSFLSEGSVRYKNAAGDVIGKSAYNKLSLSERKAYTKCEDTKDYDYVIAFDSAGDVAMDFMIEINVDAYKQGNSYGWSANNNLIKYGKVIYNPYHNMIAEGVDFNAYLMKLAGVEVESTASYYTNPVPVMRDLSDNAIAKLQIEVGQREVPNGTETIDVSYAHDGSVVAWVEEHNQNLTKVHVSTVDGGTIRVPEDVSYMFANWRNGVTFDNIDFSTATDMSYMFYNAHGSNTYTTFDTSNVTTMAHMFEEAYTGGDITSFNTSNVTDMSYMFCNTEYGPTIDGLDTSKVEDMSYMFMNSTITVDNNAITGVECFDTSSCKNMAGMFKGTYVSDGNNSTYDHLNLTSWDVSKVTDMSYMFCGAYNCDRVIITDWNAAQVTNMSYMFAGEDETNGTRYSVRYFEFGDWNTENCVDMSYMFYKSTAPSIDISSFDTINVEDMSYMFAEGYHWYDGTGSGLQRINGIGDLDTSACKNMSHMFKGTREIITTTLDVAKWDVSKVEDMSYMFAGINYSYGTNSGPVYKGPTIDVSAWDTSSCKDMSYMFNGLCNNQTLNVSGFVTDNVENMAGMFQGCVNVRKLEVGGFNTAKVTDMSFMFKGCTYIPSVNVTNFDTSLVTNMASMFEGCSNSNFTTLNTVNWNTENVTDMNRMFYGCKYLTTIGENSFNTAKVTDMTEMFYNCNRLASLNTDTWMTPNLKGMAKMFYECDYLKILDINHWDVSNITDMTYVFYGCGQLDGLDLNEWDVSNVTTMKYMFNGCGAKNLNIPDWNVEKVEDMSYMFCGCLAEMLDLNNWNIGALTDASYMFARASYVKEIDLSGWELKQSINADHMFSGVKIGTAISETQMELRTIFANDWIDDLSTSNQMFYYCTYLVGDNMGYNVNFISGDYAAPSGYFTTKPAEQPNVLVSGLKLNAILPSTVTSVTFTDTVASGVETTDLSAFGDGSVVGWIEGTNYYIASVNGDKIIASACNDMFNNKRNLKTVDLSNLDTSNVSNMELMFYYCNALTTVNTECLDTSSTMSMFRMFRNCSALTSVNVSTWDTSKLTSMAEMFSDCAALTKVIGINDLDISNVTRIDQMFSSCNALKEINLSDWDVRNVTSTRLMFNSCKNLVRIDLSNWELTNKLTDVAGMFQYCDNLVYIYADDWSDVVTFTTSVFTDSKKLSGAVDYNASSVNWNMANTKTGYFTDKSGLENILFDGWAFNRYMPTYSYNVKFDTTAAIPTDVELIDMSAGWDGSVVAWLDGQTLYITTVDGEEMYAPRRLAYMFDAKTVPQTIDFGTLNTSNVEDMSYMFRNCSKLTDVNMDSFDTHNVTNMTYMFNGCSVLPGVNMNHFDTGKVTNMSYMFYNCPKLLTINLSNWNVANVQRTTSMFASCQSLVYADLSGWEPTSALTDVSGMFNSCKQLSYIYAGDWTNAVSISNSYGSLFGGCTMLTGAVDYNEKVSGYATWAFANPDTGYFTKKDGDINHVVRGDAFKYLIPTNATQVIFDNMLEIPEGVKLMDFSYRNNGSVVGWMAGTTLYITSADNGVIYLDKNCKNMFYGKNTLTNISFEGVDTSNTTDMSYMFYNCQNAVEINVSEFNTENVTNMQDMFYQCHKVAELDLSGWDTGNVTNMKEMFFSCQGLTYLNVSGWNTENVTDMSYMFRGCSALPVLDLAHFNTSNVTNMCAMFAYNTKLAMLDLSGFDMTKVTNVSSMFERCETLRTIFAGDWSAQVTPATTGSYIFDRCNNLVGAVAYSTTAGKTWAYANTTTGYFTVKEEASAQSNVLLPGWTVNAFIPKDASVTSVVFDTTVTAPDTATDLSTARDGSVLGYVDGSTYYITTANNGELFLNKNSSKMFEGHGAYLLSVDFGDADASMVTDMSRMFYNCQKLQKVDFGTMNTENVTSLKEMFYQCSALSNVNVELLETDSVVDASYMFYLCNAIKVINVGEWDTSSMENTSYMFGACSALVEIDLTGWDISNLTNVSYMFYNSQVLRVIYAGDWTNTITPANSTSMFYNNKALSGAISGLGTTARDWAYANPNTGYFSTKVGGTNVIIKGTEFTQLVTSTTTSVIMDRTLPIPENTTLIDFSESHDGSVIGWYEGTNLYITSVDGQIMYLPVDCHNMFYNKTKIQTVSFGDADGYYTENMSYMFYGCSALQTIDMSLVVTPNLKNTTYMFYGCSRLVSLDISSFNTTNVTDMSYMFGTCTKLTSLDLTNFDTSNVTNTGAMFYGCSELLVLHLDTWNVESLTNANSMFYQCKKLTTIYAGDWTNMATPSSASNVFYQCSSLEGAVTFSKVDWSMANTITGYFSTKIEDNNVLVNGNLFRSKTPTTATAVVFDHNLIIPENVALIDFSEANNESIVGWMDGTTLYITSVDGNVMQMPQNCRRMFYSNSKIISVDFGDIASDYVVNMKEMFYNCYNMQTLYMGSVVAPNATNTSYMFYSCNKLTALDISNLDMSQVTDMSWMFYACSVLTEIDLSSAYPVNVTDAGRMFSGCAKLTTIYASDWTSLSTPANSNYMFTDSKLLKGAINYNSNCVTWNYANAETGYFTNNVGDSNVIVSGISFANSIPSNATSVVFDRELSRPAGVSVIDFSAEKDKSIIGWLDGTTLYVTSANGDTMYLADSASEMFYQKWKIASVDFGDVNTSAVTSMEGMFSGCSGLTSINVSSFDTSNVTDMSRMFYGCDRLTTLDLSSFYVGSVDAATAMFMGCQSLQTIYANDWTFMAAPSDSSMMFMMCSQLIGAASYDSTALTWNMANCSSGYFTYSY